MKFSEVLEEVLAEREAQDLKWGQQDHDDTDDDSGMWHAPLHELEQAARRSLEWDGPTWAAILLEKVGEAFTTSTQADLRAELVQVAAVAVAWVEAIDRRGVARG